VTGLSCGRPARADGELVKVQSGGLVPWARSSMRKPATIGRGVRPARAFPSLITHPNLTIEDLLLREDHIRARPTAHLAPVVPATYPNRTLASSEAEVCSIDAARASFRALRVGARRSRDEPNLGESRPCFCFPWRLSQQTGDFVCKAQPPAALIRRGGLFARRWMRNVGYIAVSHPASTPRLPGL